MIKYGEKISIIYCMICSVIGVLQYMVCPENRAVYTLFVWMVTGCMVFTVVYNYTNFIRPMSYFILSFMVFVWARALLGLFWGMNVISAGYGINQLNIQKTVLFLGISMCFMVAVALLIESTLGQAKKYFLTDERVTVNSAFSLCAVGIAVTLFLIFEWDSVSKISMIQDYSYLDISESVMLEGYNYFRIGKYLLILWVLFGKNVNRVNIASGILLIASIGYLMRGARGYAICYFFTWLLFFAQKHRIKFINLIIIGIGLVVLANSIIEYRLGYSLASGLFDIIIKTLHSQGASIEPVFGVVSFREKIMDIFPYNELLVRNDFGQFIDTARGVNFASGGFGTSFFAEVYFVGLGGMIFLIFMGVCLGIAEHAYNMSVKFPNRANYYKIFLFLVCNNIIYFARSNIRNCISRTLIALIINGFLVFVAKEGIGGYYKRRNSCKLEVEARIDERKL